MLHIPVVRQGEDDSNDVKITLQIDSLVKTTVKNCKIFKVVSGKVLIFFELEPLWLKELMCSLLLSVDGAASKHARSVVPVGCRWRRAHQTSVQDSTGVTYFTGEQTRHARRTAGQWKYCHSSSIKSLRGRAFPANLQPNKNQIIHKNTK